MPLKEELWSQLNSSLSNIRLKEALLSLVAAERIAYTTIFSLCHVLC